MSELPLQEQSDRKVPELKKGWLRVASDEFMDKNKYPDVPVLEAGATKPSNWDFITWAQTNGEQKFSNEIKSRQLDWQQLVWR